MKRQRTISSTHAPQNTSFNENIHIDGKKVAITEVGNFDEANENYINICFTTSQQLHTKMNSEKEIVLLADDRKYRIIGVPSFYNTAQENQFRDDLDNALNTFL